MSQIRAVMILTAGVMTATGALLLLLPGNMWALMFPAMKTWINTGNGSRPRITDKSGIPHRCLWAGLRIVTDVGHGLSHGAGPGWKMSPGALLRSIMDAGR